MRFTLDMELGNDTKIEDVVAALKRTARQVSYERRVSSMCEGDIVDINANITGEWRFVSDQ